MKSIGQLMFEMDVAQAWEAVTKNERRIKKVNFSVEVSDWGTGNRVSLKAERLKFLRGQKLVIAIARIADFKYVLDAVHEVTNGHSNWESIRNFSSWEDAFRAFVTESFEDKEFMEA